MIEKKRALKVSLLGLFFLGVATFSWTAATLLGYRFDLHLVEGHVMQDAVRLLTSGHLYVEPVRAVGFDTTTHTPIYYLLLAPMESLFDQGFVPGRTISLLSLIGAASLTTLIIRKKESDGGFYLVFPLIIFSSFVSLQAGITVHPRMLAVFFTMIGISLLIHDRDRTAVAPLLLAAFTDPLLLVGGIVGITYLWRRDGAELRSLHPRALWKQRNTPPEPIVTTGLYLSGLVVGVVILELWSGAFLASMVTSLTAGWQPQWGWLLWSHITFIPLFGLALFYTSYFDDLLFNTLFLLSLGAGIIQFFRAGATAAAFILPLIAAIICVSRLYANSPKMHSYILLALILQTGIFFVMPMTEGTMFDRHAIAEMNAFPDSHIVSTITGRHAFIEYTGYAWQMDGDFPSDTGMLAAKQQSGAIHRSEVISFFQDQAYERIIVSDDRITRLGLDAYLDRRYRQLPSVERHNLRGRETLKVFAWTG